MASSVPGFQVPRRPLELTNLLACNRAREFPLPGATGQLRCKRDPINVVPALVLLTGHCLFAGEVAITIDDLPRGGDLHTTPEADRAMTVKLFAPFRRERIPLTGFVNECHHTDELQPLLSLWVAAGADLGNHTCSHLNLNTTSAAAFESDIVEGRSGDDFNPWPPPAVLPIPLPACRQRPGNEAGGAAVSSWSMVTAMRQ